VNSLILFPPHKYIRITNKIRLLHIQTSKKEIRRAETILLKLPLKRNPLLWHGIKPEWMHGMGSWKEVLESKEAKLIREKILAEI